jgi:signal peptidase I
VAAQAEEQDVPREPGFWSWQNLFSWIKIIGIILLIKGCVVDQYTIPSESMHPTLHGGSFFGGDRILANKWIFGPRIPFTTIRLMKWQEPERWDIVVFRTVQEDAKHGTLVKRVVGLPGDRISIKEGHIWVNGEKLPFPDFMPESAGYFTPEDLRRLSLNQDVPREVRAYARASEERIDMRYGIRSDDEYTVIPEGHYMMLGDNSLHSLDSRVYGWVPHEHLYGRVFAIWWPLSHMRDFTGFSYTWWGKLLMYGIPALLVAFEVRNYLNERKRRKAARSGAS